MEHGTHENLIRGFRNDGNGEDPGCVDQKDPDERLLDDVGRRIGELRARAGLTQAQLAEAVAMTVTNYQRIEAGTQNLTLRTMGRIARVLGVQVVDLLTPPEEPRPRRK
jgi:ribosome-binding protein aMBF1 (putative translation factor)